MKRIYLKKLVYVGADKTPSAIDFMPGCNVISGPSDTGKTLIFECLSYVLGSTSQPKQPPQAKGYTNIFLTLSTGSKDYTIERSILSDGIKIYQSSYENITEDSEHEIVSGDPKAKESLSGFLLELVGIENKKLKRNKYNEVNSLTFNVLRKVLLIDELTIQTKLSPVLTGQKVTEIPEKSLFRYLLTGVDYSDIIVIPKPAIRKASANARIDVLKKLIANNTMSLSKETSEETLKTRQKENDTLIEASVSSLSSGQEEVRRLQQLRKEAWETSVQAESKIDQLTEMLTRFVLLKSHYQTDLERLEAIIETGEELSYLVDAFCPLCGSEPKYHRPDCVISKEEMVEVKASCEREQKKINSLTADLDSTINQVREDISINGQLKDESKKKYLETKKLLTKTLEPLVSQSRDNLRQLYETKKEIEIGLNTIQQISLMEELKDEASQELKPKPKGEKVPVGVTATEANKLLGIIENRLKGWAYKELGRIGFSEVHQDFTLGEKNRLDQGKGYRGITHAAFILSLMDFCYEENRPHPGFVVLDSPLVTLRDKKQGEKIDPNDQLPSEMKDNFYRSLSLLSDDRQVIVIENDDPPLAVAQNINYLHFTKDLKEGRYGFLPSLKKAS